MKYILIPIGVLFLAAIAIIMAAFVFVGAFIFVFVLHNLVSILYNFNFKGTISFKETMKVFTGYQK